MFEKDFHKGQFFTETKQKLHAIKDNILSFLLPPTHDQNEAFTKTLDASEMLYISSPLGADIKKVDEISCNDNSLTLSGELNCIHDIQNTEERVINIRYRAAQSLSYERIFVGESHDLILNMNIYKAPHSTVKKNENMFQINYLLPCKIFNLVYDDDFIEFLERFNITITDCDSNICLHQFHLKSLTVSKEVFNNKAKLFKQSPGVRFIMKAKDFFNILKSNHSILTYVGIEKGRFPQKEEKYSPSSPISGLVGEYLGDGCLSSLITILADGHDTLAYRDQVLHKLNSLVHIYNEKLKKSSWNIVNKSKVTMYGTLVHSIHTHMTKSITKKEMSKLFADDSTTGDGNFKNRSVSPEELLKTPKDCLLETVDGEIIKPIYKFSFITQNGGRNLLNEIFRELRIFHSKAYGIPIQCFNWNKNDITNLVAQIISTDGYKSQVDSRGITYSIIQSEERHNMLLYSVKYLAELNNIRVSKVYWNKSICSFTGKESRTLSIRLYDDGTISDKIAVTRKRKIQDTEEFIFPETRTVVDSISMSVDKHPMIKLFCNKPSIKRYDGSAI